jgi:GntR family transcriptional regulator
VKKNAVNLAESSIKIGQNVGLTAAAGEQLELKTEVLDFNVRFPDEVECNQLSITMEEPVYDIKRLRILDEKPYSLEHTIIPIALAPNITKEILNRSLYDYLQSDLGIVFGDNRQTVRAVKPDENDKQYLQCSKEDPVLEVNKVMFLERGTPLEYSVVHHRYDMVEMSFVNVSRDSLLG